MALVTHASDIVINIALGPAPFESAGFGNVLMIVPLATNSLDSNQTRIYTSATDVSDDLTAGFISATTAAQLTDAFGQQPKPTQILLGTMDVVGGDSVEESYDLAVADGADFYGVTAQSHIDADVLSLAAAVTGDNRLAIIQSDDADWLTSGFPAALSTLAGIENVTGAFHDDDLEAADLAWAVSRLVFNPDTTSAPWIGTVRNVNQLTALNETQKSFLLGNEMNVGLKFGTSLYYVKRGTNFNGRPIDHIVTLHWLDARLSARMQLLVQSHSDRGEKLTIDETGQAKGLAEIEAQLQIGVEVGHFTSREGNPPFDVTPETITQDDKDNERLRFTGRATLAVNAQDITINFNLSTADID